MELASELREVQIDAEWAFCASVFSSGSVNPAVVKEFGWLLPSRFLDPLTKKFWSKMIDYNGDGLRAANDAGIVSELAGKIISIPTLLREDEYARKITETYQLRQALEKVHNVVKAVSEFDLPGVQMAVTELSDLESISDNESSANAFDLGDKMETFIESGEALGIPTGLSSLDKHVRFLPGHIILIAGRPGVGKTAFSIQVAVNLAACGYKVLYYSVEMKSDQVWYRLICALAGVDFNRTMKNELTGAEKESLRSMNQKMMSKLGMNFIMRDDGKRVEDIYRTVYQIKPDVVIIDHLGEINWHDARLKPLDWYGLAMKYIQQNIAKKLEVPVILLHQLSRGVEDRDDKRPVPSDLRWSGDLEQKADTILMLYRNDYYGQGVSTGKVPLEVWIRKNRFGAMNKCVQFEYDLDHQTFSTYMGPLPSQPLGRGRRPHIPDDLPEPPGSELGLDDIE